MNKNVKKMAIVFALLALFFLWLGPSKISRIDYDQTIYENESNGSVTITVIGAESDKHFWNIHSFDETSPFQLSFSDWSAGNGELDRYNVVKLLLRNLDSTESINLLENHEIEQFVLGGQRIGVVVNDLDIPPSAYEFELEGQYCSPTECETQFVKGQFEFYKVTKYILYIPWMMSGI